MCLFIWPFTNEKYNEQSNPSRYYWLSKCVTVSPLAHSLGAMTDRKIKKKNDGTFSFKTNVESISCKTKNVQNITKAPLRRLHKLCDNHLILFMFKNATECDIHQF